MVLVDCHFSSVGRCGLCWTGTDGWQMRPAGRTKTQLARAEQKGANGLRDTRGKRAEGFFTSAAGHGIITFTVRHLQLVRLQQLLPRFRGGVARCGFHMSRPTGKTPPAKCPERPSAGCGPRISNPPTHPPAAIGPPHSLSTAPHGGLGLPAGVAARRLATLSGPSSSSHRPTLARPR